MRNREVFFPFNVEFVFLPFSLKDDGMDASSEERIYILPLTCHYKDT